MDVVIPEIGTLRTSLSAARAISQKFGSFMEASNRIVACDLEADIFIVAAGLDRKPLDVADKVYDVGTVELSGPLSEYVTLLANGGKMPKPADSKLGEA